MAKSAAELGGELATLTALQENTGKLLDEMRDEYRRQEEQMQATRAEAAVAKAEAAHVKERHTDFRADLARVEQLLITTREQQAARDAEYAAFRKQYDESDRRRFTLVGLIIGAILSLAVQAVVTWALRK